MLSDTLTLGSRLTFVGGKGGVGKTTVAAALALELADCGQRTAIISVDPAHSLGDALELPLGPDLAPLPSLPLLLAAEIDAHLEERRFVAENGAMVESLIERGTYLDRSDVEQISAGSLPGIDEIAALLSLQRIVGSFDGPIVVDTAPTGHTLRLLELPELALDWVSALEAMEAKHAAVATGLTGSYRLDEPAAFLQRLRDDLTNLQALLRDPQRTRFLIVTTDEAAVLPETYRLQDRLQQLGIAPAGIILNRASRPAHQLSSGVIPIPRLAVAPTGLDGLRAFSRASAGDLASPRLAEASVADSPRVGESFEPPLDRELYFVVGKGGVGKSTAAAALAVKLATSGSGSVLLLSIDPAGSLSEVLGAEVGSTAAGVAGADKLFVRQLDAPGSWAEFRERYRGEIENLFAGLLSERSSARMDMQVLERLIDLSPPGLDELMALMEVIDANEDRVYDALVVDTAPTGHLLRLLEMPAVALEWTHSLLRLLLKYRDVAHLAGTGERVLELARSLRRMQALLHDSGATYFLVVTLPDPLSLAETERLLPRLRALSSGPGALLINRATDGSGSLLPETAPTLRSLVLDPTLPLAVAPLRPEGPRGATDLSSFIGSWHLIDWAQRPSQ